MKDRKISISPKQYTQFSDKLTKLGVNTICHSGLCINRPECFKNGKIAFLVMGNICTRNCLYCAVKSGTPEKLDFDEPKKISNAVKGLNLKYVVITSVTREDLPDQGAGHFGKIVSTIKKHNPGVKIELLIPDFWADKDLLKIIIDSEPDVINHNIECAKRVFKLIRPQGNYDTSLEVLKKIKEIKTSMITKSGFMLGVGESLSDIKKTILDLKKNSVDIITIGQYLPPYNNSFGVVKLYKDKEFKKIGEFAESLKCFKKVFVGSHVRSSYHADEQFVS